MSQLPPSLSAQHKGWKPLHIWLAAALVQILVIAAFRWSQTTSLLANSRHDDYEFGLVIVGGILMLVLVGLMAWIQQKKFTSEDRVRQRLLDVIEALPDPAVVRDLQGRYVLWNKAAEKYHGIAARFVVGKTPHDLFPSEVAQTILDLDRQVMKSNAILDSRLDLPPLYGKGKRVANFRCAPIHSPSEPDRVRGAVTILHDVTHEEQEAIRLRYTLAQLNMSLKTSGFGAWIWDLEHDIVIYSPQYEKLMRYEGDNFNGDFNFEARVHPEDIQAVKDAARASLKQSKALSLTYRALCFDGEYRFFHASGEPTTDDDGRRFFAGLLCPLVRS